jgi:predicted amidohydrolase
VRDIRVATVQFQHAPGDKAYNLGRVRHFVTEAARRGVEIIAFPEMCLTGYWHVRKLSPAAFEALAEPVDGPCVQHLLRLAREHGMTGHRRALYPAVRRGRWGWGTTSSAVCSTRCKP